MLVLLGAPERQLMRTDELRRNIEALGPDAYEAMTYYERWIASIAATMLQRGCVQRRRSRPENGGDRGAQG